MTFDDVLAQVLHLLQQQGRVSYGALKRRFNLDEAYLDDLKAELIDAQRLAVDEDGRILVWRGTVEALGQPHTPPAPALQDAPLSPGPAMTLAPPEAERRQLTVLFCDLVGSTTLASQLDPEVWRHVVQAYHATCARVLARFEGRIAQYLGDGLLVYFGYPQAHEDDAARAVRAGLGIVEALGQLNARLEAECGVRLAVRLGIHTGLVVVGEVGSGTRQEQLAIGETPNVAARLQGLAAPNTLLVSAATVALLGGFFASQSLGTLEVKGLARPLEVYQVLYEQTARSRLEAVGSTGLTPLVGREQEVGVLRERWAQVKDGFGQVVLLGGEAGIGKSRLVQVLKEQVAAEPQAWLTPCQCSPYYQNTALYPVIDVLERLALRFERQEEAPQKLRKLEGFLVQYGLPLAEAMPLFTALFSLPLPADYAPLPLSPEQHKQQTLRALLTILLRIAAQQPLLFVMEDLHWVDPSTLEFLSLLVDQGPTARILALLTFRPDFRPPWMGRAHLTQLMLPRLPQRQAAAMIDEVAHHKRLPAEVVAQVAARTDGVPLFVEELTKMVLESGLLQEREERYELTGPLPPLAIPTTLHDSLMARLDRLATVKGLVQLGATLGREFAYALLQAVAPWDEATVRQGLQQLVAAEFLYQRGVLPQATYVFKHALIQEAAYQSLLKSTRQQYHQRVAQVLEAQFPETVSTQPEVLAHHYTEAGLGAQAIPYWQQAGIHATARSAYIEAIGHLSAGLAALEALPHTPERTLHELHLQAAMGAALTAHKGFAAPEAGQAYRRARELSRQVLDAPQLAPVLLGLWVYYHVRAELQTARELGEELLSVAHRRQEPMLLHQAHHALGITTTDRGDFVDALRHLEQAVALYTPAHHGAHIALSVYDTGAVCQAFAAHNLWYLGYPEQAVQCNQKALALAQELTHPYSSAGIFGLAATCAALRREWHRAEAWAEAAVSLSREHSFSYFMAWGMIMRGWAWSAQGRHGEGLAQLQQGLAAYRTTGAAVLQTYWCTLLAEALSKAGQAAEGLRVLDEALATVCASGEHRSEAELHRLRGALLLSLSANNSTQAEACFQQALTLARQQQARSLELRAAMSLSRLWQRQGKGAESRQLLAPVYGWFTEGFDTADLQEARALLEALE